MCPEDHFLHPQHTGGRRMTSFRNISGHKNAIAHLRRAILADRVSHAYLLCGDGGDDKLTLAQAFAQTLQCTTLERLLHAPALESDDAGLGARRPVRDLQDDREAISLDAVDACGKCRSCIQAADGNQPDLITWTHEKPKTFSVEDARRLVADVQIRPFSSLRKIYIVPDAHLMNVEAQNTLLKTLEEPPEYVVLLLLCDSADMMLDLIIGSTKEEALAYAEKFMNMVRSTATPEEIESLDEAASLEDISHMPARVKCATLGWKTMQRMLRDGESEGGSRQTCGGC